MRTENSDQLEAIVTAGHGRLLALDSTAMAQPWAPGKWTGHEILGHLSDSAANNRQRIVRSRYEALRDALSYEQARWVRIQAYAARDWDDLVDLFRVEYGHILHVLRHLPDGAAQDRVPVEFTGSEFVTLDWLVGHMARHTDHHLRQILCLAGHGEPPDPETLAAPIRALP